MFSKSPKSSILIPFVALIRIHFFTLLSLPGALKLLTVWDLYKNISIGVGDLLLGGMMFLW